MIDTRANGTECLGKNHASDIADLPEWPGRCLPGPPGARRHSETADLRWQAVAPVSAPTRPQEWHQTRQVLARQPTTLPLPCDTDPPRVHQSTTDENLARRRWPNRSRTRLAVSPARRGHLPCRAPAVVVDARGRKARPSGRTHARPRRETTFLGILRHSSKAAWQSDVSLPRHLRSAPPSQCFSPGRSAPMDWCSPPARSVGRQPSSIPSAQTPANTRKDREAG